jgi:RNA polymerase sigma-70 factor (ECF subfamily)
MRRASIGARARASADAPARILADNHRRFLAFLEKRVGSRDAAEDILQDAFVRGMGRLATLRKGEAAVAWFYRLLRNALADYHRRRGAEARALQRLAAEGRGSSPPADTEMMRTVCRCVTSLLDTLRPDYALALRRIDLEGRSLERYAAEAGITAGNAAVRVHRARKALKRALVECCKTCPTHGSADCSCDPACARRARALRPPPRRTPPAASESSAGRP